MTAFLYRYWINHMFPLTSTGHSRSLPSHNIVRNWGSRDAGGRVSLHALRGVVSIDVERKCTVEQGV